MNTMNIIHKCDHQECLCQLNGSSVLEKFVLNHKTEILHILECEDVLDEENMKELLQQELDKQKKTFKEQLTTLTNELEQKITETERLQKCLDLKEKEQTGSHSMYKGEYGEMKQEILLNNLFGDKYTVDGKKVMHKMDIRLHHKDYNYTIGIECKEKKSLTLVDLNKFKTDRLNNQYFAGIIISTQCPIKNKVNDIDTYLFSDNELYIYSNDANLIGMTIGCFLQIMEGKFKNKKEGTESELEELQTKYKKHMEHSIALYKDWTSIKKLHMKYDKQMIISLTDIGAPSELFRGHLYLIPKSKCKGSNDPYKI